MRPAAIAILATTCLLGASGGAEADCKCAANGMLYEHGSVVCLRVSGREWLAQCGMVLNNPSWKTIADGCPMTADDPADKAHALPATDSERGALPLSKPATPG